MSKPPIVIYTRALFTENVDNNDIMQTFNSVCKLTLVEYRKQLREIQLKNFSSIDTMFICNTADKENQKQSEKPFGRVQQNAWNQILNLPSNAIVIPIDDDDWINPLVTNLTFVNGITAWKGAVLHPLAKKLNLFQLETDQINKEEELNIINNESEAEYFIKNGFIAGCQAFSIEFIKAAHNLGLEHMLLQRHKQSRIILRKPEILKLGNFKELQHLQQHLHVYVKHAGNNTALKSAKKTQNPTEEIIQRITAIKNASKKAINLPEAYKWAEPLMKDLDELKFIFVVFYFQNN